MAGEPRHIEPESESEHPHTAAEAALRAAEMATQAARVAEHEEAAAHFAANVAHVGSAVARELALSGIIDVVLDESIRTLGARFAQVYLADEDRRTLELVGQRNLPEDLEQELSRVSFDAPLLAARAASDRRAHAISTRDRLDPALSRTREILSRMRCNSTVALPLIVRERLVGVLTFALEHPHEFTADERAALDNCAEIFSFGIANATAYEAERRLRTLFEAVGNATAAIASELELRPVLQSIADEAREVVDAEYAAIGIVVAEDRPFEPWVFSGMTAGIAARIGRNPRPVATLGTVAIAGRTIRIPDIRRHPDFRGLPEGHPEITSVLGIPIRHQGRTLGNLYIANKRGGEEFSAEDQRAVELLAAHAGAAVHQTHVRDQLESERARFSTIVENAPHGVHFVDAETGKVIANRRATELVGQTDVATIADYRGQLCTPDGRQIPREDWPSNRVLRGETVKTHEVLLRRPDGSELPLLASAAPVSGRNGRLEGVVVVYEDISTLKELQRAREEWASIVTHDLRQPLSVITTYVGMLQRMAEMADSSRISDGLRQARKAAAMLNRMISDLADASQIECKRLDLTCETVDLGVLAREIVDRERAVEPDAVIDLRVGGRIPKVQADPIRIEQVLVNLLVNAVKYSQPGTAIDVEVCGVDDEARVTVTNRGPGVPAGELPRIFDRYYRTERARAGKPRGLGLGLFIAKGIVEAHGGRIWAESSTGETTTFSVALPAMRPVA